MRCGVEPGLAVDLMQRIQHGANPMTQGQQQQLQLPKPPGSETDSKSEQPKETPKEPPAKKQKIQKEKVKVGKCLCFFFLGLVSLKGRACFFSTSVLLQHVLVRMQGSELECELLAEDNLNTFVAAWVQKAASAQGSCATIGAQWLG